MSFYQSADRHFNTHSLMSAHSHMRRCTHFTTILRYSGTICPGCDNEACLNSANTVSNIGCSGWNPTCAGPATRNALCVCCDPPIVGCGACPTPSPTLPPTNAPGGTLRCALYDTFRPFPFLYTVIPMFVPLTMSECLRR